MKQVFVTALILVVMVSSLTAVAMATSYTGGNSNTNFNQNYVYSDYDPVTCYYYTGNIFVAAKASTALSLGSDAYGTAYATLWATSGDYNVSSSSEFDNGYIYSGYAKVSGNMHAKKVEHYAYRYCHIVEDWKLTFT